jgi:MFS family permease
VGSVFGTFTLTFAMVGPLTALAIRRLGVRITTVIGSLFAALGFGLVSRADSLLGLYLSYSLIGGIGIGLGTGFPTQTLAVNWFRRYRARAIAIVMLGAAVFGAFVNPLDAWALERWGSWRPAWLAVAAISLLVAVLAAVFIRDRPEDLGQLPDGGDAGEGSQGRAVAISARPTFTALQAIRTPHFAIATLAGMANVVPWRVLSAHGRLHFEDLGFTATVAAALLGVRVGISSVGRIAGSAGDYLPPNRVMALALLVNGLGLAGAIYADTTVLAYTCVVFLGVGYGIGYVGEPVVFAHFFGRAAFVGTTGLRVVIVGIAGWVAPTLAGAAADRSGTYALALAGLAVACLVAAVAIVFCGPPKRGAPSQ